MVITDARLAELLAYCREAPLETVDAQTVTTIKGLYASAVGYMEGAGVSQPSDGTARRAQYDLIVNALVLDSLDRRGTQIEATAIIENPAFRRTLNQLKLTEGMMSTLDTGTI